MTCQSEYEEEIADKREHYVIPGEGTAVRESDDEDAPEFTGAAHVVPISEVELFDEGEDPYPDEDFEGKSHCVEDPFMRLHFDHPEAEYAQYVPAAGSNLLLYAGVTDPAELEGVYVPLKWQVAYHRATDSPREMMEFDPLAPENEEYWYLGLAHSLIDEHVKGGDHFEMKDAE